MQDSPRSQLPRGPVLHLALPSLGCPGAKALGPEPPCGHSARLPRPGRAPFTSCSGHRLSCWGPSACWALATWHTPFVGINATGRSTQSGCTPWGSQDPGMALRERGAGHSESRRAAAGALAAPLALLFRRSPHTPDLALAGGNRAFQIPCAGLVAARDVWPRRCREPPSAVAAACMP